MIRADAGRMRRDDYIGKHPQWTCRIERLSLKHVEHGATKSAIAKCREERRFIDDPTSSNVDNDRSRIEQSYLFCLDQSVGFRNKGGGNHKNVASPKRIVQPVGTNDAFGELRNGLI